MVSPSRRLVLAAVLVLLAALTAGIGVKPKRKLKGSGASHPFESPEEKQCIIDEIAKCNIEAEPCVVEKAEACELKCVEEKTIACRSRHGPRCPATDAKKHCCRHWYDYLAWCFATSAGGLKNCRGPPQILGVPCAGADRKAVAFTPEQEQRAGEGVQRVPRMIKYSAFGPGTLDKVNVVSRVKGLLEDDQAWKAGASDAALTNADIKIGVGASDARSDAGDEGADAPSPAPSPAAASGGDSGSGSASGSGSGSSGGGSSGGGSSGSSGAAVEGEDDEPGAAKLPSASELKSLADDGATSFLDMFMQLIN